jgi:CubicO group peptidase (beta-lactamase class C family)
LAKGSDINSQLCVYVKGELVIDLWGSADPSCKPDPKYGPDTLQTVFSATKSLAAICIGCMVDKGLLDYDEKVCKYWPEFAQNGKDHIKICDVLRSAYKNNALFDINYNLIICSHLCRHEAGLVTFHGLVEHKDLFTKNIKENAVGKLIEAEEQKLPPKESGTTREYHGLTRGMILNEIFRRVEPQGRTIGEFLRADISGPLGADAFIGLTDSELERKTDLIYPGMKGVMLNSMLPKCLGRKFEPNLMGIIDVTKMFGAGAKDQSEFIVFN